jgi:hypothetical protein
MPDLILQCDLCCTWANLSSMTEMMRQNVVIRAQGDVPKRLPVFASAEHVEQTAICDMSSVERRVSDMAFSVRLWDGERLVCQASGRQSWVPSSI